MLYRNTKTGIIIDFKSPVSGENWEPLKAPGEKPKEEKAVKKNGGGKK